MDNFPRNHPLQGWIGNVSEINLDPSAGSMLFPTGFVVCLPHKHKVSQNFSFLNGCLHFSRYYSRI